MKRENLVRKYLYENNMSLKDMRDITGINYSTLSMYKTDKMVVSPNHKIVFEKTIGLKFEPEIEK
jgi:hypothetical protein